MAKLDAGSMASLDGSMAQARWLDAQYCDHICDRHQASMARWLDGGLDGSMVASMALLDGLIYTVYSCSCVGWTIMDYRARAQL